ncbi:MAG: SIMPL domain-containing protein [Candidatus Limiplasma sp.]|nr:SIMPL domain-containing protein [Candidatus Limiplasma sp.]
MKKMIAICMGLIMLAMAPVAMAQEASAAGRDSLLTVTGSASVMIQPDFATLNLGVMTQGQTVAEAQAQNAVQMKAVLEALQKAGVAKEDIQTSYFNVYPVFGDMSASYEMEVYPDVDGKPVGYRVENNLLVTLRDLDNIGSILDQAMAAGANQSYSLSFDSAQKPQAYDRALQEAVKEAQRKAGLVAQAADKTLGNLVELQELGIGYGGGYMKSMVMDAAASTPIVAGTLTVEASVQVTYQLP